jgi:hypothetical protein
VAAPKRVVTLPLANDFSDDTSALALKTLNDSLHFRTICKLKGSTEVDAQRSPWKRLKIPSGAPVLEIHLANLAQAQNRVRILAAGQALVDARLAPAFARASLRVAIPQGVGSLEIRAEGAVSAKAYNTANNSELVFKDQIQVVESTPPQSVRFFEFRSENSKESFVVPMSDAQLIHESLEQIANPAKARLFVGRIEASLDGTNRNMLSRTLNPWSWSVAEAQNYADFAHISCDGTPAVVEERLQDWLRNTGGTICFWNYRVRREISREELSRR